MMQRLARYNFTY